jgi:transketolase
MGAILNGLSLSKIRPFGSGFLIFSDYERESIRLSALMEIPVIHIFTHDSIGVGEDGPTHQPVEQLASLRAIPGLVVLRPADANEVVEAYRYIMSRRHEPAVLVLSRQALRSLIAAVRPSPGWHGAYVLADAPGNPEVVLIASGSKSASRLRPRRSSRRRNPLEGGFNAVLGYIRPPAAGISGQRVAAKPEKARLAVEQASTFGWERYVGQEGTIIGMKTFGASAPLKELQKKFGFEPDHVAAAARQLLGRKP